jgi:hypothetical protein
MYFINFTYNLYIFWISPGPSSGGTTVFMWHLVLVILYRWLTGMQDGMKHSILHTRQSAIQNNKHQLSHKYSCSSWWWTCRGLKHVEVINKIDEIHWEKLCPKLVSFMTLYKLQVFSIVKFQCNVLLNYDSVYTGWGVSTFFLRLCCLSLVRLEILTAALLKIQLM